MSYAHTDTNFTTTITTSQGEVIDVKVLKNVEADGGLNQKELWAHRLSKGRLSNISLTAHIVKLKISH